MCFFQVRVSGSLNLLLFVGFSLLLPRVQFDVVGGLEFLFVMWIS